MQAYIESLIRFGSTRSKLLMFLNRSQSICGWTILSLVHISPVFFDLYLKPAVTVVSPGIVSSYSDGHFVPSLVVLLHQFKLMLVRNVPKIISQLTC